MKHFFKTILFIGLGILAAYFFIKYIAPLVAPFLVALFLAFFIEPVVAFLQEKVRLPRAAAVGIAMLVIFGGLGLVISVAITRLIVELVHLSTFLPEYISNMQSVLASWQLAAQNYYFNLPADVLEFFNQRLAESGSGLAAIVQRAQVITGQVLNFLIQLVSAVPMWIVLIIISGIATYFMSKDKRIIVMFWVRTLPAPWGRKSIEIAREIFQAIINYVRAQAILITITLIQTLIGLYLIEAPYVLLMGLVIGVADIIPVLGPSSIYIPWIIWEYLTGDIAFALKLLVLYGIVIVVRQVLETKIVSSSMGLHPLATLMSMYVGLQLFGATGLIAGPIFLITVKAFASSGIIKITNEN